MKNIIKYCIVLSVLFISINIGSAESISGYVFDENSNALNGVTISDNASIGSTTTNTTGYYYITGYTNLTTYIITASKTGYIDNTLSVDVNDNITNANITITEKGRLYDIFELIKSIIDNTTVIIGVVIMAVTVGMVIFIGAWITKLLQNTVK